MKKILGALVLSVGLLTPTVSLLADPPHHEWSANEDPYWHQYLKEHHKKDHDWSKASRREQQAYWKWRDSHPDHH